MWKIASHNASCDAIFAHGCITSLRCATGKYRTMVYCFIWLSQQMVYCFIWLSQQMVYCFIWLSQLTGPQQETIAQSKPTTTVNIRGNENATTQWLISVNRRVLCHIGLMRDHGCHLVNQPCFSVFEKCCKTIFECSKHS